jgi:hypothetical protein
VARKARPYVNGLLSLLVFHILPELLINRNPTDPPIRNRMTLLIYVI